MAKCSHGAIGDCPDCASDNRRLLAGDEFGINECPPAPAPNTPQKQLLLERLLTPRSTVRVVRVYQSLPQEMLPEPGETKVYQLVPRVRGRLHHLTFLSDLEGMYMTGFTVGDLSPLDWSCCDKLPLDSWFPRTDTPLVLDMPVQPGTPIRIGLYRRVSCKAAQRPLDGYLTLLTVGS